MRKIQLGLCVQRAVDWLSYKWREFMKSTNHAKPKEKEEDGGTRLKEKLQELPTEIQLLVEQLLANLPEMPRAVLYEAVTSGACHVVTTVLSILGGTVRDDPGAQHQWGLIALGYAAARRLPGKISCSPPLATTSSKPQVVLPMPPQVM